MSSFIADAELSCLIADDLHEMSSLTGMRKFRIDQDFLIEHWQMMYIMPVVFAEIYFLMKLNSNFRYKLSIN